MHLLRPRSRVRVDGISKSGQVSPKGIVKHRDNWDDTVDAKVLPAPIRVKATPSQSEWLRLLELEDATAQLRQAQLSGSTDEIRRAKYRFEQAKARFETVRFGERTREVLHAHQNRATPRRA